MYRLIQCEVMATEVGALGSVVCCLMVSQNRLISLFKNPILGFRACMKACIIVLSKLNINVRSYRRNWIIQAKGLCTSYYWRRGQRSGRVFMFPFSWGMVSLNVWEKEKGLFIVLMSHMNNSVFPCTWLSKSQQIITLCWAVKNVISTKSHNLLYFLMHSNKNVLTNCRCHKMSAFLLPHFLKLLIPFIVERIFP